MDLSPEDGENGQNVFLYEKWSFTVTQKSCFSTKLTIHTHVDLRESSQYGFFVKKNVTKYCNMESPFLGKKARSF